MLLILSFDDDRRVSRAGEAGAGQKEGFKAPSRAGASGLLHHFLRFLDILQPAFVDGILIAHALQHFFCFAGLVPRIAVQVQRVVLIFCHFADARIQLFQGNIHRPFNMRILELVWGADINPVLSRPQ